MTGNDNHETVPKRFDAYVETATGGGKDATFDTAAEAFAWLDERLAAGGYHWGDVTDAETGDSVPRP